MRKLVLASNNSGKLRELRQLLAELDYAVQPQGDFHVAEAEESGLSFVENAILKARNACRHTGLPAVADDSGLEVDALDGRPGIYSARFAGVTDGGREQIDARNNEYLLELLRDVPEAERTARYQCLLVLMRHAEDPTPLICQGSWEGRILPSPRGSGGFGYDPLFFVPGENASAAELPAPIKNRLSHRGKAMAQLLAQLRAS